MLVICKYCGNSHFSLLKIEHIFLFKVDSVYTILIQVGPDSGSDMAHFCIFVLTPRHFAPRNVFLPADYMQYLAYSNICTPIDTTYYSTLCLHGFLVKKKRKKWQVCNIFSFLLSFSQFPAISLNDTTEDSASIRSVFIMIYIFLSDPYRGSDLETAFWLFS